MDTSKEYIKMCGGASEIQKLNTDIWIPRQDELQDMVLVESGCVECLLHQFTVVTL